MLAGTLALAIVVVRLFPETPLARALHLYLVELPLEMARRIERKHIILLVIVLCAGQTLALAGSVELGLAYAAEMAAYYDALLAASLAAAAARVRGAWLAARTGLARIALALRKPRARSARTKARPVRAVRPDNDDEPAPARRAAAA